MHEYHSQHRVVTTYFSYTSFAVFWAKHVGKHSSGTFYVVFRDPGQILITRDCPGDSGTVGAYGNPCMWERRVEHCPLPSSSFYEITTIPTIQCLQIVYPLQTSSSLQSNLMHFCSIRVDHCLDIQIMMPARHVCIS